MADFTEFAPLKYDQNAVAQQGYGMAYSGPTDDRLIVGFYKKSIHNPAKSREVGTPQHEDVNFVKIQHPGETLNIVDRPARADDAQRWPRQWHQFIQNVEQKPDGIPISLLFPDKPSIVATLRGYNIHTVEQLANLSAEGISRVGLGCQEWVNAAARYVERAEKGVSHHKFEAELAKKDEQLRAMQRQIADLTALVQQAQKPAPNVQTYDFQSAQIAATHQSNEPFVPEAANFVTDLSSQVQPKRRGRPPGQRKEH